MKKSAPPGIDPHLLPSGAGFLYQGDDAEQASWQRLCRKARLSRIKDEDMPSIAEEWKAEDAHWASLDQKLIGRAAQIIDSNIILRMIRSREVVRDADGNLLSITPKPESEAHEDGEDQAGRVAGEDCGE